MANIKISALPAATDATGVELLGIQNGANKRVPADLIKGSGAAVSFSNANPSAPGTPNPGSSQQVARADHVHPPDDTKLAVTGTKTVGRIPTVENDMSVVWKDPPAGGGAGGAGLAVTKPLMNGVAAVGDATTAARADHVHDTDTSRMANPTGTKAAGKVPLVTADGSTVSWASPPTDTSRMANPTGTMGPGKVPTVSGDGATVAWTDPPTGSALTVGGNRLIGSDAQGNIVPLRATTTVMQSFIGTPVVGSKLVFTGNAPWPGTVDQIAVSAEGAGSPTVTLKLEKVTSGTGTVLGGISALAAAGGAPDNPNRTNVSGARDFSAGDALRATVMAVSGTITGFSVELTLNRVAG